MAAPKRELFKAAEVCEVVKVQPYVLRSWEAEFPQLGQAPAGGGARVYRRSDIELVLRIKQLVFDEGLTLSGARRRLDEDGDQHQAPVSVEEVLGAGVRQKLKNVRTGLQSILQMLSRDADQQGELRLVPPPSPAPAAKKKSIAKGKAKK
jgi:DNA-binding transcriptional MerR regulator